MYTIKPFILNYLKCRYIYNAVLKAVCNFFYLISFKIKYGLLVLHTFFINKWKSNVKCFIYIYM
jgi:hypothetical protein